MSRYTSKEKLSEKKMSSSTRKKVLGMFLGGIMAISSAAGLAWGALGGELDKSNNVKEMKLPFTIAMGTQNEPSYSDYMNRNINAVNKIKKDITRYQELLQMPNHSERHKIEIDKLADKIVKNYGEAIKSFSLHSAKAKLADAYNMSLYDVKISGSILDNIYVARNKITNQKLVDQDSSLLVSEVIHDLIHVQNDETRSNYDNYIRANSLCSLFGKTTNLGYQTLHISKNGKLVQVNINELNKKQSSKDDDYLR